MLFNPFYFLMLLQCLCGLLTVNENQTDILHPAAVSQFNRLDA